MPRRSSPRSSSRTGSSTRRSGPKEAVPSHGRRRWFQAFGLVLAGAVGLLLLMKLLGGEDVARLQGRAEAAARASHWASALDLWRRINETSSATSTTYLGEGQTCLALGRAAQAERALRKAAAAAPRELEAWLLLLRVMWVEDRPLDAFRLGWEALDHIPPEARPQLLRELTLAALTDLPDDLARSTLNQWIAADAGDVDARVALLRRMGAEPRADDPDRESRLAQLGDLVASHPDHVGAREALVTALGDAGEPERGRTLLESWPVEQRDGRFWRLRGRWDLEHDHRPDQAVTALRAALADFPQDWRIHYRLARALQIVHRPEEARHEAETVSRIRELLDPLTLGPKLDAAFSHLDHPAAFQTLANLCDRAGLTRLADVWRAAGTPPTAGAPVALDHWLGHYCFAGFRKNRLPDHCSPDRPRLLRSNKAGGKETRARLSSTTYLSVLPVLVQWNGRHIMFAATQQDVGRLASLFSPTSGQVSGHL
jgi:thioredoxin-like negative regulator of GroEL